MRDDIDLHLHTAHVGCANETMSVPALLAKCEELGYTHIAITDHYNGPHHAEAQRAIREDLRAYDGPLQITWGVELTIADADAGTLTADEATVEEFGWEFVIGGPHGRYGETDVDAIIATQHRLMLATLRNPLVDALVHPWWFSRGEFAPGKEMAWMTDMSRFPTRRASTSTTWPTWPGCMSWGRPSRWPRTRTTSSRSSTRRTRRASWPTRACPMSASWCQRRRSWGRR